MEIPDKYKGKYFFHFTHIENLDSIVKHGLLSTNEKNKQGIEHKNVASETIQHRRSEMSVTCSPNGNVHDYVPFYFNSKNLMLLSLLNSKNVDQLFIIFIAISIDKIAEANVVFTDASANTSNPPNFYTNPDHLDKLDWNAIDKRSWKKSTDEERHKRMAEALVFEKVPFDWIDSIIVWNDNTKNKVIDIFKNGGILPPKISFEPFDSNNNRYYFFFTKFALGRPNETLVTGPYQLQKRCFATINSIVEKRKQSNNHNTLFENIEDALNQIEDNFCAIEELEGIYELETDNKVHNENVSDHTIKVVENLDNNYYNDLKESDKNIVKLSAYLHDIGKGPKSKWENGIQKAYPDHPADAIPMLERILTEDFKTLSEYEVRKICLLVVYHDLVGEILGKERSKQELLDLDIDENELNMLIAISLADVFAIGDSWSFSLSMKLPDFVKDIKQKIK